MHEYSATIRWGKAGQMTYVRRGNNHIGHAQRNRLGTKNGIAIQSFIVCCRVALLSSLRPEQGRLPKRRGRQTEIGQ